MVSDEIIDENHGKNKGLKNIDHLPKNIYLLNVKSTTLTKTKKIAVSD